MNQEDLEFSIVVPTYNRPRPLALLLEQLTRLSYPRERFEVILVDDGSDPPLEPAVDAYSGRLNLVWLRQAHGGVAKGRHAGAEAARGKFLAFTDDDCLPAPDWLTKLEEALKSVPNCAAGGRTLSPMVENPYCSATQTLISYLYARMNSDRQHARFFANNNMALVRDLYFEIGGLDPSWAIPGEDRDLCARWLDHGYRLIYVPEAIVYHTQDLTLGRFCRQHFNYGRGAFRFHDTCARRRHARLRLEPLSFYLALPFAAFEESRDLRALRIAALLVLSQVATTAGFVAERFHARETPPT